MKKIVLLAVFFVFGVAQLVAQTELKTQSISIFENGQSFFHKSGSVKTSNRIYRLTDTPQALFGTLWFSSKDAKIDQITSKLDSVSSTYRKQAMSFSELLFANIGKPLTIITNENKVYTGVVTTFESPSSPIAILKVDNKWISIATNSIKSIEFGSIPQTTADLQTKVNKTVFDIKFDTDGLHNLDMVYLQNGLNWVPTYLLELTSKTSAKITMQAELSNNSSDDITNTNVNLVVGAPNFMFANKLATLVSFAYPIEPRSNYSKMLLSSEVPAMEADFSVGSFYDQPASSADFYYYPINNLSLTKRGRGSYTLFEQNVPIKHIFKCNLSNTDRNSENNMITDNAIKSDVYHNIEIDNKGKNPFTSGSIMVIDKVTDRPLVETQLNYTGANQKTSIVMTKSQDVTVQEKQELKNKQANAKKYNQYSYNLLLIESEVTITNSKKEDIELDISKKLNGKILKASIKYTDSELPNLNPNNYNINAIDIVNFKLVVKAGQTFKFNYTYQKYEAY